MKKPFILLSILSVFLIGHIQAQTSTSSELAKPTTTMEFESHVFDFGTVDQGEVVTYIFEFTNTGDIPLIISRAKGSCGCTIPYWPKTPILPGETNEIEVKFDTKGKKGLQSKRVSITANTDPEMTFLTVKGEVLAPDSDAVKPLEFSKKFNDQNQELDKAITENIKLHSKEDAADCIGIYPNPTSNVLRLD